MDAVKGINMFKKADIPVSSLPEGSPIQIRVISQNPISSFLYPAIRNGEEHEHIHMSLLPACYSHFRSGWCRERVLEDVPLHASILQDADRGKPTVVSDPAGVLALAFEGIAKKVSRNMLGLV